MRATLGLLLIGASVWLFYGVITGRTLNASATTTPLAGVTPTYTPSGGGLIDNGSGQYLPGGRIGPGQKGSGPDDMPVSTPLRQYGNVSTHTPGGLPTMASSYGAAQGRFV